jgi:drug/metabolite transporter (DMT)-like permease
MQKEPSSPDTGAFQTTPIAATIGVCLVFLSQIIMQTELDRPLTIACYGFAIGLPLLTLSYTVNKSRWQWPLRELPLLLGYLGGVIGISSCFFRLSLGIGIAFVVTAFVSVVTAFVLTAKYGEP